MSARGGQGGQEVAGLPAGMHVLERGWLSSNNIVFIDAERSVMVDSGYWTHADQTKALVESVLGHRSLDVLVNTHLHSDHCGGNAALQVRYPQLQTHIPPGQAALVDDWDPVGLTYQPTGQHCPRFTYQHTLQPGSQITLGASNWEVHAAPGHDPHSVVLFNPAGRILISADALWENGFGVVFPELDGEEAFGDVARTLDIIERLKPSVVIPGHGRVFTYSDVVLERARKRLEAFVLNPTRHAHHAAKVLLKFKLLEVQQQFVGDFTNWAMNTPYLMRLHEKFFASTNAISWVTALCEELVLARVAAYDNVSIHNA